MRPSSYARYWVVTAPIRWPFQLIVWRPGSRVYSVRNGLPSTWPPKMTWATMLVGCSGLVIGAGWENDGRTRSTRRLAGATGRQPRPLSGLMHPGPAGSVAGAAALCLDPDGPQAPAASASATARPIPSTPTPRRRTAPPRQPPMRCSSAPTV
jgi:hypothetical protein